MHDIVYELESAGMVTDLLTFSQSDVLSSVITYAAVSNGVLVVNVDTIAVFVQLNKFVSVHKFVAGAPLHDFWMLAIS
jgi:hypothetical protein